MLMWSLTRHVGLRRVVPCVLATWVRLHVEFFKIKNDIVWLFYTHFSSSTNSLTSGWSSLSTATHQKASSTTTVTKSSSSRIESSTWCNCPIWIRENTKSVSPTSSLSLLHRSTFSLSEKCVGSRFWCFCFCYPFALKLLFMTTKGRNLLPNLSPMEASKEFMLLFPTSVMLIHCQISTLTYGHFTLPFNFVSRFC